MVDVTRLATVDPYSRVPHLAFQPTELADLPILPMEDIRTSYYLRVYVQDQLGVMADLTRILADAGISIDAVLQKEPGEKTRTDIVIITHQTREKYVNAAIEKIEQLPATVGKVVRIRLESLS
jgi:homoserine dehydrogenase